MDTSNIQRGTAAASTPDVTHVDARGVVCTIVPPYLLQAMGQSPDAEVRAIAERTLRHDSTVRAARASDHGAPAVAAAGSVGGGDTSVRRSICDAHHGTDLPGTQVRAEGAPASSDVAVNEAYDALGDTHRLYREVYGRNSVDGHGLELVGSVHYSTDYDNAFWNGEQMVFGDGDGVMFTRFTAAIDVIGHELTHGVTQYTAALVYQDQSGALNESMSDVFGSLVKQYALGQDTDSADWLIGAGILGPKIKGRALRDMLHPGTAYDDPHLGKDPQPADMAHYVQTSDDNGGVHLNSGIPNRAFALAATTVGGRAWEGVGRVWYDVLTGGRMRPTCDFATFAGLTVDAAIARFGATHAVSVAVQQAWQVVGVLDTKSPSTGSVSTGSVSTGSVSTGSVSTGSVSTGSVSTGPGTTGFGAGAAGVTPASDEVQVRRTGGIAGIVRQTTVRLDQLSAGDAEHWQSLLVADGLPALQADRAADAAPGGGMLRDGYTWAVECPARGLSATLGEESLPAPVRHLFERTLDAG